jgi:hypothetical protein
MSRDRRPRGSRDLPPPVPNRALQTLPQRPEFGRVLARMPAPAQAANMTIARQKRAGSRVALIFTPANLTGNAHRSLVPARGPAIYLNERNAD